MLKKTNFKLFLAAFSFVVAFASDSDAQNESSATDSAGKEITAGDVAQGRFLGAWETHVNLSDLLETMDAAEIAEMAAAEPLSLTVWEIHEKEIDLSWDMSKSSEAGIIRIEKSVENARFELLDEIPLRKHLGKFADTEITFGLNIYRVKFLNYAGKITHMGTAQVFVPRPQSDQLEVVYDAGTGNILFHIDELKKGNVRLQISSTEGRIIRHQHTGHNSDGDFSEQLTVPELIPGEYVAELFANGERKRKTIRVYWASAEVHD